MRRRAFGWVVILLAAVALSAGGGVAEAEALQPVASEPRPRQILSDPPGWVTVAFSRELDDATARLVVLDSKGKSVTINGLIVEGTNMTAQLENGLPRDTFTVHYRVGSAAGDVEGGAFQFAYGKGQWSSLPDAQWSGANNEPSIFLDNEPGGNASAQPTVPDVVIVPSSGPSVTMGAPTGGTPPASAAPGAGPSPAPAVGGNGTLPVVVGAVVLVVIAIGGAIVAVRRRKAS